MTEHLLVEERPGRHGRIGVLTLNAPRKLNALGLDMIETATAALQAWARDDGVAAVVLTGAGGKAFCAGGDIREVVGAGHADYAERYFANEYRLDHLIHCYSKPLLVWGDGIVMGGGLGLMAGASVRLVTPRSLLAMPEITIGLFPDVGASYFLNRMPGRSGLYLALTGARLNAADAQFAGLADYHVAEDALEPLLTHLDELRWSADARANLEAVREAAKAMVVPHQHASPVRGWLDHINARCDHVQTLPLVQSILADRDHADPWLRGNAERLAAGSPTAAAVIHEQLRRSAHRSLAEVFRSEAALAVQFTRRHDFPEGVRALLVDKDNQPAWRPARLDDLSPEWVEEHFASPWVGADPLAELGP